MHKQTIIFTDTRVSQLSKQAVEQKTNVNIRLFIRVQVILEHKQDTYCFILRCLNKHENELDRTNV